MAASDPNEAPGGGEDPRLASLDDRLKAAHRSQAKRTKPVGKSAGFGGKGAAQAHRVLSALIGAPLGAGLIGWLLDKWFKTAPALMLVMLFLGFGAAITQVIKISKERAE